MKSWMIRWSLQDDRKEESELDRRGHGWYFEDRFASGVADICQASPGHVYSSLEGHVKTVG